MRFKQQRKSEVRGFERAVRIQRLVEAGIIQSPDAIPADAIPARLDYAIRCRASLSLNSRPPYFADQRFWCSECHQWFVWPAEAQRQWYENSQSSPYSKAVVCRSCRQQRRGGGTESRL